MSAPIDHIFQAARQEVVQVQALLEEQAELFNQTFALSSDELEQLHVHAELHGCGGAIEFCVSHIDIVFSLGMVFDRQSGCPAWELVAFHGERSVPQWVCTMRIGLVSGDRARRLHGARLVAAIGDYLEREGMDERQTEIRSTVIGFMRMDRGITQLPQVAALTTLQYA